MAGITKCDGDAIQDRERTIVIDCNELTDGFFGVDGRIERFDRRLAMFGALFGNECSIIALNLCGIFEHDRGKITRGKRAVNVAFKTLATKVWKVTAMIDVRMAQNGGIDFFGIEREVAIALNRFFAFTLEKTALEQKSLAVDLEEIHRAGGGASRAEKTDLHPQKNGNRIDKVECFIVLHGLTVPI